MPGYCGGNTEAQTVTAGMANVSEVWTQKQTQDTGERKLRCNKKQAIYQADSKNKANWGKTKTLKLRHEHGLNTDMKTMT